MNWLFARSSSFNDKCKRADCWVFPHYRADHGMDVPLEEQTKTIYGLNPLQTWEMIDRPEKERSKHLL